MLVHGRAAVTMPGEVADGVNLAGETDEHGAYHVRNESLAWCEQATYYKALNPTPGTGIAMGIQTSFSDTANVLSILVNSSSTVKVIPHYLRLINTVAGASTTSSHLLIATDTANRFSSGGTDLTTEIVSANSAGSVASAVTTLRFGALTATAITARKKVARHQIKTQATPCWVIGDEVVIRFASDDSDQGLISGAAAARYVINTGPVVLQGQNHSLLIHMWNPANATTAPNWECEWAWFER